MVNLYFPNGGRGPQWVQHKLDFYRHFRKVAQRYMAAGRPAAVTGSSERESGWRLDYFFDSLDLKECLVAATYTWRSWAPATAR